MTSGTRVSSRLARGSLSDGWQKVPDDWLGDSPKKPQNGSVDDKPNVSSLFDDASDLTDLSDEESKQASVRESPKSGGNSDFDSDLTDSEDDADENDVKENGVDGIKAAASTADHGPFIEFETVSKIMCFGLVSLFSDMCNNHRMARFRRELQRCTESQRTTYVSIYYRSCHSRVRRTSTGEY